MNISNLANINIKTIKFINIPTSESKPNKTFFRVHCTISNNTQSQIFTPMLPINPAPPKGVISDCGALQSNTRNWLLRFPFNALHRMQNVTEI